MSEDILTPEQIVESLKKSLGDSVLDSKIQIRTEGVKKRENRNIWITISRDAVHKAAEELMKISYPHLSCISGYDKGADSPDLRVQYIFSVYGGLERNEIMVIFSLDLPKNNAVLPTLTDLMEGTAFTEHEKEEYLGIKIEGLVKAEHKFFLPQDFPENIYPLRKDDKKIPDTMVRNLYECKRPKRENPPLEVKENGGAE